MPVKVAACKNRPSNVVVNLRIHHGGKFEFSNHTTNYSKGKMQLYSGTLQSSFNVDTLRKICVEVLRDVGNYKGEFEIWYILRGKSLTTGRCLLTSNDDIAKLLETKDHVNYVTIYVIEIELCYRVACILRQRQDPEDFVDDAYTKAKYLATYTPSVGPMPGPSQWEHIRLPEPLPPVHKKMPGRPSSKKRKKEPGESETTRVKRVKKANKCSNCGELGHYKRTCKKAAVPPSQLTRGGKPPSNTEWAKQARAKAEKRKALKVAYDAQIGSHSASQTTTIVYDFPTQASSTLDSN